MTEIITTNDNDNDISTFRFKFNDDIVDILKDFSKLHQYDDRDSYKDAWKLFIEANTSIINDEITRLNRNGYIGDVYDKMYKASRYYFRKKLTFGAKETKPISRRKYISMDKDFIEIIDQHIQNNISNENFTPAWGYDDFCTNNDVTIKQEINRITDENSIDLKELEKKIKKTYKNRYFQFTRK